MKIDAEIGPYIALVSDMPDPGSRHRIDSLTFSRLLNRVRCDGNAIFLRNFLKMFAVEIYLDPENILIAISVYATSSGDEAEGRELFLGFLGNMYKLSFNYNSDVVDNFN